MNVLTRSVPLCGSSSGDVDRVLSLTISFNVLVRSDDSYEFNFALFMVTRVVYLRVVSLICALAVNVKEDFSSEFPYLEED